MAQTVIIHLLNQDPIVAEMETMPDETSSYIKFTNPRMRDEKNVGWATPGARSFMFPWSRINFIEVMTTREEESSVIKPYRD